MSGGASDAAGKPPATTTAPKPADPPQPQTQAPRSFWSRLWRWETGRQKTGYQKLLIWEQKWPFTFDSYLLRYPPGTGVTTHTDPVQPGFEHHRINIILKNPAPASQQSQSATATTKPNSSAAAPTPAPATATSTKTGDFICPDAIINWSCLKYFRPDIHPHSVTPTPADATGYRWVLSIGWLRTAPSQPPQPQSKTK